jgi:hypothetical protein
MVDLRLGNETSMAVSRSLRHPEVPLAGKQCQAAAGANRAHLAWLCKSD